MPSSSLVNNFDVGNSSAARLLNTAGYRFLQSDVNDRNQYAFRFDYQATTNHRFEFIHQRFKEIDDRTDLDAIYQRPKVFTDSDVKLLVGAWRWTATPKFNNELRIGGNLAPVDFVSNRGLQRADICTAAWTHASRNELPATGAETLELTSTSTTPRM